MNPPSQPEPSGGRVTLTQVAQAAKVAISTASLVLNGKAESAKIAQATAAHVHLIARKLGYAPNHFARSLRLKHSGLLGVVLPSISQDVPGEVFAGISEALTNSSTPLEPLLTVHNYDPAREQQSLRFLAQNRVEAIIATPVGSFNANYASLVSEKIAVVYAMHGLPEVAQGASGVYLDSTGMSHLALQHLVLGGARRIAYLAWDYGTMMSQEKLEGIQAAAMKLPEQASITSVIIQQPGSSFESSLKVLFSNPRTAPDALLCNPYPVTIDCLDYLDAKGISIPQDCAVMSLHDHSIFQTRRFSVSAIQQDSVFIGRRAAEIALARIRGQENPPVIESHTAYRLIQRASTPRTVDILPLNL